MVTTSAAVKRFSDQALHSSVLQIDSQTTLIIMEEEKLIYC